MPETLETVTAEKTLTLEGKSTSEGTPIAEGTSTAEEGNSTAVGMAAKPDILAPARIPETSPASGPTAAQERTRTPRDADNRKVETPVEGMLTTVGTPATQGY
jgi:hypothetical protein